MSNLFTRYWQTLAAVSVPLLSSYICLYDKDSRLKQRLLSTLAVQAASYERRDGKTSSLINQHSNRRQYAFDDDNGDNDEDDDDDDKIHEQHKSDKAEEMFLNIREKRFHEFASVEYNGEVYMTSTDFLESIVAEEPRPRIGRRILTDDIVQKMLYHTPPKHRGSKRFFRTIENNGLISYMDYLFLWVILTKPSTQFKIAFAMFDTDGNELIDKREFLLLGKLISNKRMLRRQTTKYSQTKSQSNKNQNNLHNFDDIEHPDTTLLLHLFGRNGRDTLNYNEFKRFMENFQTEINEIEFTEFSHGFKTISDVDFAEILLRYTNFDSTTKKLIIKKVKKSIDDTSGITFEEFYKFSQFLNNLDEFCVAMRFHQLSGKPISQAEFQRAIRISTGFELDSHIIALIFRIFDADNDQHLSYEEFVSVMKHRLSRGFQSSDSNDTSESKFDEFKRCLRQRAKYDSILTFN